MKEYTEELCKKDLNELDKYGGVVSHSGGQIFWSVKPSGLLAKSSAVNKASGCKEILVDLFKSLKDGAIKVSHSICQQMWTTQKCTDKEKINPYPSS